MLHEHIQKELGFPEYYGRNLSALADCLSDVSHPTLITIRIDEEKLPAGMEAYVLRLAQVCAREALANENVSLIIEHPSS
jgi:RNAse (barnase) inhibitor barstar